MFWGTWGLVGFFLEFSKDCLEGEVSRGFCAQTACSGGAFAPGAVDLCTTA